MGGDHKCPVCQATFTRPQHVARHMRSHTGDRPYKCVHCGDQFARSDLLSRHVNKCHAGAAKSGSSSTAGRRKGSTAAARATTSKQACDQCVQSSLPCDGSNPCAKCVARKTRCTFVKFHRQTAPVGPGHASSLSASTLPSSTTSSLGYPLDLHPGLSGPSGGASGGQFLYAQQAAAGGGFVFPPGASHSPTTSVAPPYPAPPGSREGGIPQFAHSHPAHYGDYRDREYEGYDYDRYDGLDASSEHSGSVGAGSRPASSAGLSDYGGYHHHNGRQPSLHAGLDLQQHGRPPHHPHDAPGGRPPEFSNAFGLMSLDDPNVLAGLASDGVPFFANMPPDDMKPHHTHGHRLPHPIPLPLLPPPLAYQPPYGPPPPGSSGSTSSAGGSVPGNAQTPGTREAETRELREFWKAYMRTPLTGPSSQGGGDPMAHASALGLGMQTPSASASNAAVAAAVAGGGLLAGGGNGNGNGTRRYRVNSLPSVRTPEGEMDAPPIFPMNHQQHAPPPPLPTTQSRTMHNPDDLRSYEAAVLARKAPELVLRKPGKRPVTSASGGGRTAGESHSHSPPQRQQQPQQSYDFNAMAREASSASSLAGVFGHGHGHGHGHNFAYNVPPSTTGTTTGSSSNPASPYPNTPSSSNNSQSDDDAGDGDDSSGGSGGGRPSFKRLPSQTLEPLHAKRTRRPMGISVDSGMGMDTPTGTAQGGGGEMLGVPASGYRGGAGRQQAPLPQRRARRLSAPASPTAPGFAIT